MLKLDPKDAKNYKRVVIYAVMAGFGIIFVLLVAIALVYWTTKDDNIQKIFEYINNMGVWGYILMGFIVMILNYPLTFAYLPVCSLCGFMYGMGLGLVVVVAGTAAGMLEVFVLFRYLIRRKGAVWIEKSGGYLAKAMMFELHNQSNATYAKLIVLIRLAAPVPPGLQTAILAVSAAPLWLFQSASMLSMLLKQVPVVYFGSLVRDVSQLGQDSWGAWNYVWLGLGAVGIIIIIVVAIYFGKRIVERAKQLKEEDKLKSGMAESLVDETEQGHIGYDVEAAQAHEPLVGVVEGTPTGRLVNDH